MGLPRKAAPRVRDLIARFPHFLNVFNSEPAFVREGQLEYHLATIRLRRTFGSVTASLANDDFLKSLYSTLQAWGIGVRASNLLPFDDFRASLQSKTNALAALESLAINQENLDINSTATAVWEAIHTLNIVRNKTSIVPGTKALHHVLPDLVVPFDRKYTQEFFGWHPPQIQQEERRCFLASFSAFSEIARQVRPEQYVRDGWNSSRTKVFDNALVGFVRSGETH
jgi:hypothetical protein